MRTRPDAPEVRREQKATARVIGGFAATFLVCLMTIIAGATAIYAQADTNRFHVATNTDDASIKPGTVVLKYTGMIVPPMAERLRELVKEYVGSYPVFLLDLDSQGGLVSHTSEVVEILADLKRKARLDTVVRHGAGCLSACIPIFMQGQSRRAGGASVWLFHGACSPYTNVPSMNATQTYLELMIRSGVSEDFLCELTAKGVFSKPGRYWVSGYELFHVQRAAIVTELLPSWQTEEPIDLPFDPQIRPR